MTITEKDLVAFAYDVELPNQPKCKVWKMETGDWFVRGPLGSMLNIHGKWEHYPAENAPHAIEAAFFKRTTFPSLSAAINAINKSIE